MELLTQQRLGPVSVVEHGLVRPSFVPPPPIRRLRDLTRFRAYLIHDRTRQVQRLHNVLEDAGIKLSLVATDILGVSGRAMLTALIAGQRDPEHLAGLALEDGSEETVNQLPEGLPFNASAEFELTSTA